MSKTALRPVFVLVCVCGTGWTQQDIDDYNDGDPGRAMERHKSLWAPDGKTHEAAVT